MGSSIPPNGFESWVQGMGKLQSQLYAPYTRWLSLFSQPILPGWNFGNITVNEQNSSSPATEYDVVSQYSYGQQLGRLLDVAREQVEQQPEAKRSNAAKDLLTMAKEIDDLKAWTKARRAQRLQGELRRLKEKEPAEYRRLLETLRPDLG
ncbi:hypothetical protein [Chitinimonas sp.]|uniref:hypothetical protein n=1 Tax=Chitinimonas sp. TaxID=1934313 RepID=UPI002F91E181